MNNKEKYFIYKYAAGGADAGKALAAGATPSAGPSLAEVFSQPPAPSLAEIFSQPPAAPVSSGPTGANAPGDLAAPAQQQQPLRSVGDAFGFPRGVPEKGHYGGAFGAPAPPLPPHLASKLPKDTPPSGPAGTAGGATGAATPDKPVASGK